VTTSARDGVILVTVLWTVALLAILAVAAALTFRGFVGVVMVERERLKADGLLTAGLEVAGGLVSSAGDTPLLDMESTIALASGSVHMRLDDEGGRIDIGRAPVQLLAALFRAVGAPNPDAVAKQVVDWRHDDAPPAQNQNGAQTAGQAGAQTGAQAGATTGDSDNRIPAFSDIGQLVQVPGMRAEWVAAVAPLATVFGNKTVNPLTAPAQVIAALPGINGARLAAFLDARRIYPTDGARLLGLLGGGQDLLDVKAPQAVAVELSASLADGYAVDARAVIVSLKKDYQPYRVLMWKPSMPQPRL
jgi:general secretion pathway protein K